MRREPRTCHSRRLGRAAGEVIHIDHGGDGAASAGACWHVMDGRILARHACDLLALQMGQGRASASSHLRLPGHMTQVTSAPTHPAIGLCRPLKSPRTQSSAASCPSCGQPAYRTGRNEAFGVGLHRNPPSPQDGGATSDFLTLLLPRARGRRRAAPVRRGAPPPPTLPDMGATCPRPRALPPVAGARAGRTLCGGATCPRPRALPPLRRSRPLCGRQRR